ncbi:RFC checkpoint protein Rad17 [Savitreella phatthalungensis]
MPQTKRPASSRSKPAVKRTKTKDGPTNALESGFRRQIELSPRKVKPARAVHFASQTDDLEDDIIDDFDDLEDAKPIHKPRAADEPIQSVEDTRSWLDLAPLEHASDLAVNPRKVDEVRTWLNRAFDDPERYTMAILSGPAGAGKTATIEVLSRELDYDIVEWQNPSTAAFNRDLGVYDNDYESLASKFDRFLSVSDAYGALPLSSTNGVTTQTRQAPHDGVRRKVVVVEDIPNVFGGTGGVISAREAFGDSLLRYVHSGRRQYPLVVIVTETEPRADYGDLYRRPDMAMTVRTLLPPALLHDAPNVKHITFNQVARTFLTRALIAAVDALPPSRAVNMSTALIEQVAAHTNGDVRSALNALEFVSGSFRVGSSRVRPRGKRKRGEVLRLTDAENRLLSIVTNRDAALGYFHAMGKVVYNKRLSQIPHPIYHHPDHPLDLTRPENDPADILEESGTDVGFFISGIGRNYLASCGSVEVCGAVVEALSWYDGGAGAVGGSGGGRDFANLQECAGYAAVLGVLCGLPHNAKRPFSEARLFYPPLSQHRKALLSSTHYLDTLTSLTDTSRTPRICQDSKSTYLLDRASFELQIGQARADGVGGYRQAVLRKLTRLRKVKELCGIQDGENDEGGNSDDEEEDLKPPPITSHSTFGIAGAPDDALELEDEIEDFD